MNGLNRRRFIQASATTAIAAALPLLHSPAYADTPLKVGFVYIGPVNDGGWNTAHEAARQAMMKALGDRVTSTYVANVNEGPDSERVFRDLANQGCGLIFGTSFGYMDPLMKVARSFPNVKFEMCTGFKKAPNVANYNIRFHEGRSVIGTIAGMLTKSNIGGYLGTFPVPEVVSGINSFQLAAQKVNPKFKTKVIWINTWFDPAKEADAARALIDQGVDVMTQHTDSPAAVQVCEKKGIPTFGQGSDQSQFAPTMCKTSTEDQWSPFYISAAKDILAKSWQNKDEYWGIKEGALKMAPIKNVPDNVKAAGDKVIQGWIDGSYNVYAGPIKDQKGNLKVKEGESLSFGDILGLNWLVDGVEGTLG
jgi:simple sugar transport system substrate-binding protein